MKLYLIATQTVFVLCILPWVVVWGLSAMVFDAGIQLWNTLFFGVVSLYPVAVIGSALAAWMLKKRNQRLAIYINLIPALWFVGLGLVFVAE